MDKPNLRMSVLEKRLNASADFRKEASHVICRTFEEVFGYGSVFLLYMPIKCEVDTLPLINVLHNSGKKVYLPCVRGNNMVFRLFTGFESLIRGNFGVFEPSGEPLEGSFDTAAIPAVAFDGECNRLGYGKGFYDRFFASAKSGRRVGLAYDFQIVEKVFAEPHDEPIDIIITEKRIIRSAKWI